MYCRYCGAPMEDNESVCSACGENNVQTAPKKNIWKSVVAVLCILAIAAGAASAIYFSINGGGDLTGEDISVKSSYTGTDSQVLESMDTVVAKAGEFELTNGELQVAYWSMVYDFLTYYGDYAAYIIDLSKPLDQQYYNSETGVTWQQYFLETALNSWRRYEVLSARAEEAGVDMSAELQDHFDTLYEDMEAALDDYGFESVADFVTHDFGVAGTFENYESYMRIYYYGNEYYGILFESLELTDAELEAYYAENQENFESAGYSKEDGRIVDVRHILLTPNDDENATDYTDAEWAACKERAEDLLALWLQGDADEDSFAELAAEYSSCPSSAQGGLIEDIMEGQMVAPFEEWCMDETHEYGDYGIVKTSYGYHLIFYVDGGELWREVAWSNLASERLNEQLDEQDAQYPLVVEYSKIWLDEITLS